MCVMGERGPRLGELLDEKCGVCCIDELLLGAANTFC